MPDQVEYYLVDKKVLPEVFIKVMEVKQRLNTGESSSVNEAVRKTGLSRSAYYKYKDCVFNYEEQLTNNILSVYLILREEKGVLSSIISKLYELNTNILTINQNIPVDSVATVTVSVRFDHELVSAQQLKTELGRVKGVVDVKLISGE